MHINTFQAYLVYWYLPVAFFFFFFLHTLYIAYYFSKKRLWNSISGISSVLPFDGLFK